MNYLKPTRLFEIRAMMWYTLDLCLMMRSSMELVEIKSGAKDQIISTSQESCAKSLGYMWLEERIWRCTPSTSVPNTDSTEPHTTNSLVSSRVTSLPAVW